MNDLIALLIIWVIITIFNQIFKKKEQKSSRPSPRPAAPPEMGEPAPPVAKPQIPPILQELLGIPEVEETTPPSVAQETQKTIAPVEDQYEKTIEEPVPFESEAKTIDITAETPALLPAVKTPHDREFTERPLPRAKRMIQRYSLKEAFILKEILDDPVSQKILKRGHPLPNRRF